jgi:hypothetical protein
LRFTAERCLQQGEIRFEVFQNHADSIPYQRMIIDKQYFHTFGLTLQVQFPACINTGWGIPTAAAPAEVIRSTTFSAVSYDICCIYILAQFRHTETIFHITRRGREVRDERQVAVRAIVQPIST